MSTRRYAPNHPGDLDLLQDKLLRGYHAHPNALPNEKAGGPACANPGQIIETCSWIVLGRRRPQS